MNKIKSEARKEFDKANGATEFVVIKIDNLPDDCPVLVVQEMPNKSLAKFHLADNVIVPKTAIKTIRADIKSRKIPNTQNKNT
jgi:hypothetical protein